MNYRKEIDGLRALAVLPVIFFHAGFDLFSGGYVGVDIFFVISGYLITSIILNDLEKKTFSLLNFYQRRVRRILPALFVVSFLCIPFAFLFMLPNQLKDFSQSLVSISIFSSNILFWLKSGYFAPDAEYIPLLHTWSLALEEQFYLLFPIFLIIFWKYAKNKLLFTILFLSLISLAISEWGWRYFPSANFYLLPSRVWELFSGSICALVLSKKKINENNLFSLFGFGLILFSIFFFDSNTPFPSLLSLFPVSGTVLLILFVKKDTLIAKLLSNKLLVGLGLISYSVYLFHHPLFAFARLIYPKEQSIILMILLSLLSIIFGAINWRYVEQPFRKQSKISLKLLILILSPAFVFLIFFGTLGHKYNGYQDYFLSQEHLNLVKSSERSSEKNCQKNVQKCIANSDSNTIILLGDSNAYHFSSSLKQMTELYQLNYIQLTKGGCLPLSSFSRLEQEPGFNKSCIKFNSEVIDSIKLNKRKIGTVVVSAAWLLYYHGENYYKNETTKLSLKPLNDVVISADGINKIDKSDLYNSFSNYLENLIKDLESHTQRLIIVGPIPPALVNFENKLSFLSPINSSKNLFEKYSKDFDQIIINLKKKYEFDYIDLKDQFCDYDKCKVVFENNYLYGNPTHLSDYGQNKIMKPIFLQLLGSN